MRFQDYFEPASRQPAARARASDHFDAALEALSRDNAPIIGQWTPKRQVTFLSAIADGATAADAARSIGVTARSAYSFRNRSEGTLFSLGWSAAKLLARESLDDALYDRAVNGQTWTIERSDGTRVITTTRHRFDNRLAMSMLTRLDQFARDEDNPSSNATRYIAGDFDGYLARIIGGANQNDVIAFFQEQGELTASARQAILSPEDPGDFDEDGNETS